MVVQRRPGSIDLSSRSWRCESRSHVRVTGSGLASCPTPPPTASSAAISRLMRDTDSCNFLAIAFIVMPHFRYAMRCAAPRVDPLFAAGNPATCWATCAAPDLGLGATQFDVQSKDRGRCLDPLYLGRHAQAACRWQGSRACIRHGRSGIRPCRLNSGNAACAASRPAAMAATRPSFQTPE